MPKKSTKEYWWVSVAGADCEPAVVVVEDGERRAYTIGCPDPFRPDDPKSPIKLIEAAYGIPLTPKQERAEQRAQERYMREHPAHCYRTF